MSSLFVKWSRSKDETFILAEQELARDVMEQERRRRREEAERRRGFVDLSYQWTEPTDETMRKRAQIETGHSISLMGTTFYPDKRR